MSEPITPACGNISVIAEVQRLRTATISQLQETPNTKAIHISAQTENQPIGVG